MPRSKPKMHCRQCDGWGVVPNELNLPFHIKHELAHPLEEVICSRREYITKVVLRDAPECNMQNKGHHKSCACPRAAGPELRRWLLRHKMFTKCDLCRGKGKVHVHVAVARALKKAEADASQR